MVDQPLWQTVDNHRDDAVCQIETNSQKHAESQPGITALTLAIFGQSYEALLRTFIVRQAIARGLYRSILGCS